MRRVVRDRIAAALEYARPTLEEYIAEQLQYPLGFPYNLAPAAVLIREVRTFKIVALAKADLPGVSFVAQLKALLAHRSVELHGPWDPGALDIDLELTGHGAVAADGTYKLEPTTARLTAWWRDTAPAAASRWVPRP